MAKVIAEDTKGVFAIAPTPFANDGSIDYGSTDNLIEFYLKAGVHGITILGVMGEAPKLSDSEQKEFALYFMRKVGDRVPIIVGVSNPGIDNLVALSREVMRVGAAGIMVAGNPGLKTDDQIFAYFSKVIERVGPDIPVCVQDYPTTTAVYFSTTVLNRLFGQFPSIKMFKHEDWPGLPKLSCLRLASSNGSVRRVSILTGNGGLFMPQEMLRGADGIMTGFSFPEMLVSVYEHFSAGKSEEAEDIYDLYLPLVRHEHQSGIGLALRKETLRLRSVLKSEKCRDPGTVLDQNDKTELARLLSRLKMKLKKSGMAIPHGL